MESLTRMVAHRLPIVSEYRQSLDDETRCLKLPTATAYVGNVASFVMELGEVSKVQCINPEREEHALRLVESHQWSVLNRERDDTLTARMVTLSRNEVCDVLSLASQTRKIQSMATFCSAVGGFYRWLASSNLLEKNHFEDVRTRLKFRWRSLQSSIEECRE
jgi:hypothetical protein